MNSRTFLASLQNENGNETQKKEKKKKTAQNLWDIANNFCYLIANLMHRGNPINSGSVMENAWIDIKWITGPFCDPKILFLWHNYSSVDIQNKIICTF